MTQCEGKIRIKNAMIK